MRLTADRLTVLPLAVVSAGALVQSMSLETWDVFGPGPGLFPIAVAVFCCLLCAALLVAPGLAGRGNGPSDTEAPDAALDAPEIRTYRSCVVALIALAALSLLEVGFTAMCLITALIITWYGERRPLGKAVVFGVICAVIGLVLFGRLLGVDMPASAFETTMLRYLR